MSHIKGNRWTYEEVKEFIEIESGSGLKLLNKEFINNTTKLAIQCHCGEIFNISLRTFMSSNKRECNKCSQQKTSDKQKHSFLYVKTYIESLGFALHNNTYINNNCNLILSDNEGYFYTATFQRLSKNIIPDKFNKSNSYTIQNIKLWLKLNNKPFELLSDTYNGTNKKLKMLCLKENCGDIFYCGWSQIYGGQGCSVCTGKQAGLSNCLSTKYPDLASEWHPTKNGKLTPYNITCGSTKQIWWQCNTNPKHEWKSIINNRIKGSGCPHCKQSKGEVLISSILLNKNINNTPQYRFINCKYKNTLPFDFYLPKYNMCIEYQGLQHYEPVDFAGKGIIWAEKQFILNKKKDTIKQKYCKDNNIKLLEISYWDCENIEEILIKKLNL